MTVHTWRCRRTKDKVVCDTLNLAKKGKCVKCGGAKQPSQKVGARTKHLAALDLPYEWYVEQFGERCGICGKPPKPGRKLDRDHDHKTHEPRGLLCGMPCNKFLFPWMTPQVLRRMTYYLERHEERLLRAEQARKEAA